LKIQHSHAGREQKKGKKRAGWVASGWAVGGKSNKCNDLNLERCVQGNVKTGDKEMERMWVRCDGSYVSKQTCI